MNKLQAKLLVYQELCRQAESNFHFVCVENGQAMEPNIRTDAWNLAFSVTEPLNEMQITFEFFEEWFDVLSFPHPRIIEENCVSEMVRLVNFLNGDVMLQDTNGRFFVDEKYLDVAYSARLSYKYLELMPHLAVSRGILGFLSYVSNVATPLYQVAQGYMTADEGYQYILDVWNQGIE